MSASGPMAVQPLSVDAVAEQIRALGVQPGQLLQVHTAFSKVGPVEGGPLGLIAALRAALGEGGTLVMPSMSYDDDYLFDPRSTPCTGMGIVAETFWQLPGVLRSDNPHAFAASGPLASRIVAPHSLSLPHGLDSPVGRVYELGGHVLLLGVGHTSDTTIHLAEHLAGVRYRRPKHLTVLRDGVPSRFDYEEIDHCCQRFALVDGWLDEVGRQRFGVVGQGEARLASAQAIVDAAVERLRIVETTFLHPIGTDHQCDEARASLPG